MEREVKIVQSKRAASDGVGYDGNASEDNTDATLSTVSEDTQNIIPFSIRYPIGTKVEKSFEERGVFQGQVTSTRLDTEPIYCVTYSDGDEEEYTESELKEILCRASNETTSGLTVQVTYIASRKRKHHGSEATGTECKNSNDNTATSSRTSDDDQVVITKVVAATKSSYSKASRAKFSKAQEHLPGQVKNASPARTAFAAGLSKGARNKVAHDLTDRLKKSPARTTPVCSRGNVLNLPGSARITNVPNTRQGPSRQVAPNAGSSVATVRGGKGGASESPKQHKTEQKKQQKARQTQPIEIQAGKAAKPTVDPRSQPALAQGGVRRWWFVAKENSGQGITEAQGAKTGTVKTKCCKVCYSTFYYH